MHVSYLIGSTDSDLTPYYTYEFQFDTLFMFVISVIMIIGLFEGHSIRENDIR